MFKVILKYINTLALKTMILQLSMDVNIHFYRVYDWKP